MRQYLESADAEAKEQLIAAIQKGWVSWHGLPFTMHSEVCSADLYEYGLSLSKKLDEQFHTKTTGAKYTDVPGHTAAIIPYLVKNGMTFLHIGVNPASTAVQVLSVFRWKFGEYAINVMYNGGAYGEFTQIPGTDTYVYFAHTDDNRGPQSAELFIRFTMRFTANSPAQLSVRARSTMWWQLLRRRPPRLRLSKERWATRGFMALPPIPRSCRSTKRCCETLAQEERECLFKHL